MKMELLLTGQRKNSQKEAPERVEKRGQRIVAVKGNVGELLGNLIFAVGHNS